MILTRLAVFFLAGAVSGFHLCSENCNLMKNSSLTPCDTNTRACFRGCIRGHYGNTCNMTCDINCQGSTCQQRGGICRCKPGYKFDRGSCVMNKGAKCKSSNHCRDNMCLSAGRKECLSGCDPDWFGSDCNKLCREHKSGKCADGCSIGLYGALCDQKCSQHCVSGCDQLSGVCVQCKASYGECMSGCKSSHYGSFCNLTCKECKDGDCDQDTGECRHKEEEGETLSGVKLWIGGSVAVIIVILIAAGLFYMYRRLRRIHGVVYDIVKWRRPSPSAVQDVQCGAAPRDLKLEEEVSAFPRRVCPISPARQTSYIEPRQSGDSRNILHIQSKVKVAGVSDQQEDEQQTAAAPPSDRLLRNVLRRSDECLDSYTLPSYVEVNEELMASLPQPAQGAEACTPLLTKASFSVVADVHSIGDISIPLIAESFGHTVTRDSSTDKDSQPYVKNYDHLFSDGNSHIGRPIQSGYIQVDDEPRITLPGVQPLSTARSASYIEPRHSGGTVPTQQDISTASISNKQEDEPQDQVAPPSDQLLQHVVMTTLPQTLQGAEAPIIYNSSSSNTADVHRTGGGESIIPLIGECFGLTETENSTPEEGSQPLVENDDHVFRNYMEH